MASTDSKGRTQVTFDKFWQGEQLNVFAASNALMGGVDIEASFTSRHDFYRATPASYVASNPATANPDGPLLRLDRRAAQHLMDDLYRAGFRPTDEAGEVKAAKRHIESLEKLATTAVKSQTDCIAELAQALKDLATHENS